MRKSIASAALGALVAGVLVALPASPAAAITAGIPFSADDLPTWQTNGVVRGLATAHGKVIAVGAFTEIRPPDGGAGSPMSIAGLAIFDAATGTPDACQLPLGLAGGTPVGWAVAPAPDGDTLFVGGNFGSVGGVGVSRLAEIDVQSCTVTSFQPAFISSFVYGLAVTDTTVYVAGRFETVGGQPRDSFAALSRSDGSLLPWVADAAPLPSRPQPPPAEYDYDGHAVAVSPDGTKVAIGGGFDLVNGLASRALAIVDATTGSVVQTYTGGFIPQTSMNKALVTHGGALYAGFEGTGGGVFDGSLKIDWTTHQQVWRDTCLGATQAVLPYEGILYEAHHHHDCSSLGLFPDGRRIYLTASTLDSPNQLGWYPTLNDGTGEGIGPRALAVGTSGGTDYLWVGGEFTLVNGDAQQGLTRFGPNDTGNPPIPVVDLEALTSGAIQVRARSVYDPDDGLLTYAVYRDGSSTPIWTGQAGSTWWYRPQVTFVDTTVTPGLEYSYRVRAIDAAGNQSPLSPVQSITATGTGSPYATAVIADEPTLYWRYDDPVGTWAVDASGQTVTGKNGLTVGDLTRDAGGAIPGDPSRAATFNGTSQYIWNDQIALGPTTFTIETWFNTTSTKGGSIVGYGNGRPRTDTGANRASSNYDRIVYIEDSGRVRFGVYTGSVQTLRSDLAYNDGEWHHVVASQGPAGMRLYIDGALVGQNGVTTAQSYYGVWHVGGDNLNSWPNAPTGSIRFYNGLLDETAVYPRALTLEEVIEHYQLGGGDLELNDPPSDPYGAVVFDTGPDLYWRLDESSGSTAADASWLGGRDGAIGGSVTLNGASAIGTGTSARTPGSNSSGSGIIAAPSSGAPTTFTVEAWIQTNTTTGGKIIGFENNRFGTATSYDKHIYMRNDGRLVFGVYTGSTQTAVSAGSYNDNQWHHIVGTQGPNGLRLYVDGALVASNGATANENFTGFWRVGGGNLSSWPNRPSTDYFNGSIDEVAIYSAELAPATILTHYAIGQQDATAPSVPTSTVGTVTGTAVGLTWAASTDNYGLAGYRIYRGPTDAFTTAPELLVDEVTTTAWVDPDETPGTRYYRVSAYDLAGNESGASDVVTVNLTDTVAPTTPTNLQGSPANADVSLSWDASTDNVAVDHYVVHRGTTSEFVADATTQVGTSVGAGYLDTGRTDGTWYYRVAAVDALGNASAPTAAVAVVVSIDAQAPSVPAGLTGVLTGAGAVSLAWSASTDDVGVAGYRVYRGTAPDFVPGASSLIDEVASPGFTDTGMPYGVAYYRVAAFDEAGNVSEASEVASVVVPVTVTASADTMVAQVNPSFVYGASNQISARSPSSGSTIESYLAFALPAAPEGLTLTGATLRVTTSTDPTANSTGSHQLSLLTGSWSEGSTTWSNRPTTGFGAQVGELSGATALNTAYTVTLDAAQLAALVGTNVSFALRSTSTDNVRLFSKEHTIASARPTLTLTYTLVVADTQAPSVPAGLSGAGTASGQVTLDWSPSTDNVGVAGYRVYRGDSAGFVADGSSEVGDVAVTEFVQDDVAAGTWYYRVAAFDAAGNVSAASAAVEVTVPQVLEPVVLEVTASADTMVAQVNPSFVYGASNQISARSPSSGSTIESYLAFALPAAPAGYVLSGATLRVTTSTDPTANSTGSHQLSLLTGSWSEGSTTWSNRPTTGFGAQVGELSGATALNTAYTVTLDAAQLAALVGTNVSFALRSTSTDNVRLFSKEHTIASARPTLILTYTQV